ncbi:MAG: DUF1800 domain-containing protein [Saprospiraceae bacterium]|nr:DUF1800 domain-containing protein [Saprospiraceae bacterium]
MHRAGFGMGPAEWRASQDLRVEDVLRILFGDSPKLTEKRAEVPDRPVVNRRNFMELSEEAKMELREDDEQRVIDLRNEWLYRMASAGTDVLREKMVLFWHGHFACKCPGSRVAMSYLDTLQKHALGSFRELLLAIAREPAMIRFLNNQQNRKGNPNENFARELLELFTMGEGNYSERDIKEAARAFTGWSSSFDGHFIFRRQQHDYGEKTFMGERGRFNGDEIIGIILAKQQTADYVASRLYTFFVNEEPDAKRISELGEVLYQSNYNIKRTMEHLFSSHWFYEEKHIGTRIKSPVELLVQHIKLFNLHFENPRALLFLQNALGQVLLDPPNVAGWPSGQAWINNSTLMLRLNLAAYLLQQESLDHASLPSLKAEGPSRIVRTLRVRSDLQPILNQFYGTDFKALEGKIKDALLATNVAVPNLTFPREQRESSYARKLIIRTVSIPEFQMA